MNTKSFSITVNNEQTDATANYIKTCGGNAFDMAIALQLVACVTEPLLTGIGGSGIAVCKRSNEEDARFIDFFSTMPSTPLHRENRPKEIEIDFGESKQTFYIDCGAIATPTIIPGLRHIHQNFATLPWTTLVDGAIEVSKHKIPLRRNLQKILTILHPIVSYNKDLFDIFYDSNSTNRPSFMYASTDDYIEIQKDPDNYWKGKSQSLSILQSNHSRLRQEDILNYQVIERIIEPIILDDTNSKLYLPDFPSFSGYQLKNKLQDQQFLSKTVVEQLQDLYFESDIKNRERFLLNNIIPSRAGNTSHISIVDSDGNSISMTTSLGESCGLFLPNTRILMNNFLGETDVTLDLAHKHRNKRLMTMCCPTILANHTSIVAFGAAGSSRIRSVILQAINHINMALYSNSLKFNSFQKTVVDKPRLHYDTSGLHVERGHALESENLIQDVYTLHNKDNLFFGCLNIAAQSNEELYYGADKRRDAVGYII